MRLHPVWILVGYCIVVLAFSAWAPADWAVWVFENSVGVVGVTVLVATRHRFQFSKLVYVLVGVHFTILAIGAKYTYAEMPLFTWLKEQLDLSRNHYDRVGHLAQGFFPAMIAREIILRVTALHRGKMLFFVCVSISLALSAFWELIEWWVVVFFYPNEGTAWLGTQGDVWDAQKDMFMALIGACLSQLLLNSLHDRSMDSLSTQSET